MANPLGNDPQNGRGGSVNPFFQLVRQIRNGQANPQAVVQMLLKNNPQVAQQIDQLREQNGGKVSYQDLAMNIMKQRGNAPDEARHDDVEGAHGEPRRQLRRAFQPDANQAGRSIARRADERL